MGFRLDMAMFEGIEKDLNKIYMNEAIHAEALKAGARVVQDEMLGQAAAGGLHPNVRTSKLLRSVRVGPLRRKKGEMSVTIGVHSGAPAFYAAWVEFGHGGPRPAKPHPYVVSSFDAACERAYAEIHRVLENAKK